MNTGLRLIQLGAWDFTVLVTESTRGSTDSLILHVGLGGLDEIYAKLTTGTSSSAGVGSGYNLRGGHDHPEQYHRVEYGYHGVVDPVRKTTDSEAANTLFGKIAGLDTSSENEEAILAGVDDIKSYVDSLEGSLGSSADSMVSETIFGRLAGDGRSDEEFRREFERS